MTTVNVKTFTAPNLIIKLENIRINSALCTFTANVSMSANGFVWSEPEKLSGKITLELKRWLTVVKDEKFKVKADNEKGFEYVASGRRLTSFQRFLEASGFGSLADSPDMLSSLEFECHNLSENYLANPFRIVRRIDGNCTMTLVNLAPKKRIETLNEETGEHTIRYSTKYGKFSNGEVVKAFIATSNYKRFIFEEVVTRELYQEPAAESNQ